MSDDEITAAARALINRHIRSMDHAEVALHLTDDESGTRGAADIAARHRWPRSVAEQVLNDLVESGLAASEDGQYRLNADFQDADGLADLRQLYHRHPVTLVRAIYAAPIRVRPLVRQPRAGGGADIDVDGANGAS